MSGRGDFDDSSVFDHDKPIREKRLPTRDEGVIEGGVNGETDTFPSFYVLVDVNPDITSPILRVKKLDGIYRIVQSLRIMNAIVKLRHPTVPDSYTILNHIPSSHQYYSILDLKDAFWGCLITEDSKQYFAFEWEQEEEEKMIKQQLTWTVLPQGYTESWVLSGQALQKILRMFTPPSGLKLLQYVDNLLLSGEQEKVVEEATVKLLNFLAKKPHGIRVSKKKVQLVERKVKYLGHILTEGLQCIDPERIASTITPDKIGVMAVFREGQLAQTLPLDLTVHNIQRGNWVLVKECTEDILHGLVLSMRYVITADTDETPSGRLYTSLVICSEMNYTLGNLENKGLAREVNYLDQFTTQLPMCKGDLESIPRISAKRVPVGSEI
ncbi:endogenous retrovirus group K member 113 Pol protein-like protein [Turdus rufiventris]|nr:endogenous retrovirus group K member 113 Pol protein-like protein [Turdus rufiventris]